MYTSLISFLLLTCSLPVWGSNTTGVKILSLEEVTALLAEGTDRRGFQSAAAKERSKSIPQDYGGNYGDLIYRYRENGDVLLLREVVVIDELSPSELEVQWYASVNARRISSLRVLNIGRERAYCARIDVAGAEAQAWLRVPSGSDPRVLIEIYGF